MQNIEIKQNRGVAIIFVLVMLSIFFFAMMASIDSSFQSYKTTGNSIKEGSLQGTVDQALFDAKVTFKQYAESDKISTTFHTLEKDKGDIFVMTGFSSYSRDYDSYKNFKSTDPESLLERRNKLGLWINKRYYTPKGVRTDNGDYLPKARFVYLRRNEQVVTPSGLVVKNVPYKRYAWSVYRNGNSFDINYHKGLCFKNPRFDITSEDWDSWDTRNLSITEGFGSNLFDRPDNDPWLTMDHALASIPLKNRAPDKNIFKEGIVGKLFEELPAIDISKRLDMGRVGKNSPDGIRTVDHPDWDKIPMLTKSGGEYDHLKDQIKANIIDYSDTNYYATTDINGSDFSDLNKKATYVGNEAVHNISEILINFVNRTDRNPSRCSVILGAYIELQNMYGSYSLGELKVVLIADVEVSLLTSGGYRKVREQKYTFTGKVTSSDTKRKDILSVRLKSGGKELLDIWKKNNGSANRQNARLKLKQVRVALIKERDGKEDEFLDFVDIKYNNNLNAGVKKGANINFRPYDIRVNSKRSDFHVETGNYGFSDGTVPENKLKSVANDLDKWNKTVIPKEFNNSGQEVYYYRDVEKMLKNSTVNFSNFSTSHFRNKPWKTTNQLFELGAISRGESLRTINLIEYNPKADLGKYKTSKQRISDQGIAYADCGDRGLLRYMYVNEDHRTNPSYHAQKVVPILPTNIMRYVPFKNIFRGKKYIMKHGQVREMTYDESEIARARADIEKVATTDDCFDYKDRTGGKYGIYFSTVRTTDVRGSIPEFANRFNNDFLGEQLLMSTKDYFSNKIEYFYVVAVAQGLTYSQDHTGNRTVVSPTGNKDTFFVDSETRVRALYGYDRINDKFTLIEYKEF